MSILMKARLLMGPYHNLQLQELVSRELIALDLYAVMKIVCQMIQIMNLMTLPSHWYLR